MTETITFIAVAAGVIILAISFYKFARSNLKDIDPWHSGAVCLTGLALLGFGLFNEITVKLSDDQSVTLKKEIERLEENLSDVQLAATAAASQSAQASEEVQELKSSVESSVASVEQIKDSITESVAESVTQSVASRLDVPEIQKVNQRLEEVAAAQADIDDLSATVADQNAQIAALSAQLARTTKALEDLQGRPVPGVPLREGVVGTVYFGLGSTALSGAAKVTLDRVARELLTQDPEKIVVAGHADSSGDPETNQRLAQRRADEVAAYLIERGLTRARISVEGLGDADPVVPTASGAQETFNRRVEISVE
ncbi:MAG: OmpA family protein [Pseudomonadota bacterium]